MKVARWCESDTFYHLNWITKAHQTPPPRCLVVRWVKGLQMQLTEAPCFLKRFEQYHSQARLLFPADSRQNSLMGAPPSFHQPQFPRWVCSLWTCINWFSWEVKFALNMLTLPVSMDTSSFLWWFVLDFVLHSSLMLLRFVCFIGVSHVWIKHVQACVVSTFPGFPLCLPSVGGLRPN